MDPRDRHERQNPVERVMRPGFLLLLLLIGFAFMYLLTPSSTVSTAKADGSGEEIATAQDPEDYAPEDHDDETEDQVLPEEDGDGAADDDDDTVETEHLNETPERGGQIGEGYDDDSTPLPGDDETDSQGDTQVIVEDEDKADPSSNEGRHRECIYVPGIDTFRVIDDKHLTVSTSPRRIYLVTLWNRCPDLRWSHQIAINSYSSWTCSYSRDTVIAGSSRCIIDDVERVGSFEAAEDIVADRTGRND